LSDFLAVKKEHYFWPHFFDLTQKHFCSIISEAKKLQFHFGLEYEMGEGTFLDIFYCKRNYL
jgi:hypothetical protein